ELAYGMEQLGLPGDTMRRRVEETLDLLGIADLRNRDLRTLSGGQQQRVAIGSVLTMHPRVLVLDEPTSALDPTGAEEVLAAVTRLVHDLAVTVVIAEHRVERVLQYADRVVHVVDGRVESGLPAAIMETSTIAPPVVELGRWAGWKPLPLSVRDGYRSAGSLRSRLEGRAPAHPARPVTPVLDAHGIVVRHGDIVAVAGIDLVVNGGEVAAVMGRNGAGKSSLLWALQGSGARTSGKVIVDRRDPRELAPDKRRAVVGLVPQTPSDLLYLPTVTQECAQADLEAGVATGTCRALLDRIVPGVSETLHPNDLSEGQRLALVLAIQLTSDPQVLLLDEPTRGLDYPAKKVLAVVLRDLAAKGRAVLLSTHDVEFVAEVADRVIVLAAGEIVADGPTGEVVSSSPAYAPQVSKVVAGPWLTVDEVRSELD
ncbi:MAG: energy-coupling factor transporter ATP-binding protein, partial [Marmoricola sp.]|nr:energy-coupling factor transporter ATP-binding protein [Marmoricola sp.]